MNRYILPDGKWCSAGTCHIKHDEIAPGEACHRDSTKAIALKPHVWNNASHVQRLRNDRLENHKYFGHPGQPQPLTLKGGSTNSNAAVPQEGEDETAGSMSFMFDVGSPDYSQFRPLRKQESGGVPSFLKVP